MIFASFKLIEGSLQVMVICLFKLVQTTKTKRCLLKRCPFTVGKQIAFSWWLPDSRNAGNLIGTFVKPRST